MPERGRLEALTARQAAGRLGVKVETIYAYVSRGILERRPGEDGRSSRFDARAVERLARKRRGAPRTGGLSVVLGTALTLIEPERVCYRGLDVADLAGAHPFEAVADWLWLGETPPARAGDTLAVWRAEAPALAVARAGAASLPPGTAVADRLRAIVALVGPGDPLRFDLAPEAVARTGRRLIAALVDGLPAASAHAADDPADNEDARIAARLGLRLGASALSPDAIDCLDATLTLIADHGLAASTLAARVAASTRADPYSVVSAGLGALSGPLHGAASADVHRLFEDVGEPARAVALLGEYMRRDKRIPGFGHMVYEGWDPRARILYERLRGAGLDAGRWGVVEAVLELLEERAPVHPNIDFFIGAYTYCTGMDERAGEALFGVARSAGWLAHALEEYEEPALRFRPRAHYMGAPGVTAPSAP